MTVYVDDMYLYPLGRFGRMKMSHMIADTEEELHEMADKIGVARKWYQGDHYDISIVKRRCAIFHGAREVTLRELSRMALERRRRGKEAGPLASGTLSGDLQTDNVPGQKSFDQIWDAGSSIDPGLGVKRHQENDGDGK